MISLVLKTSQYFPKPYEPFGGDNNDNNICLIMQQNLI